MLHQLQFDGMPTAEDIARHPSAHDVAPAGMSKLDRNRQRITGEGNPRTPFQDTESVPVERYGLSRASNELKAARVAGSPSVGAHDTWHYRTMGETRFVNLVGEGAVQIAQDAVNPQRVRQLARDPEMGRDPRFPDRDLPKVVATRSGDQILVNGTHRSAADVAYNGKLFTEARVVSEEARAQRTPHLFRQAQALRNTVAAQRVYEGDATAQYRSPEHMERAAKDWEARQ